MSVCKRRERKRESIREEKRLRAYFPKILFPERAFVFNQETFPANIYGIRLNSQRYSLFTKTYFSNLHAFNTPTHFPKKLARFLLQQIATPPNYYFYYLEVLQGVSINNFHECVSTNVSSTSHIHRKPNYSFDKCVRFPFLILRNIC